MAKKDIDILQEIDTTYKYYANLQRIFIYDYYQKAYEKNGEGVYQELIDNFKAIVGQMEVEESRIPDGLSFILDPKLSKKDIGINLVTTSKKILDDLETINEPYFFCLVEKLRIDIEYFIAKVRVTTDAFSRAKDIFIELKERADMLGDITNKNEKSIAMYNDCLKTANEMMARADKKVKIYREVKNLYDEVLAKL